MDALDQMIELVEQRINNIDERKSRELIVEDDDAEEDGDVEENGEAGDNENDDNEDEKKTPTTVVKKPRKPSNRPKLDVERLKGSKGLLCMEKMFSNIEFQGPNHEKQDLDNVMSTLHYWCHRLFPKFSFDDTLEHLERLGAKKSLITLKKKIIFDLIADDEPAKLSDDDEVQASQEEQVDAFSMLLEQETVPAIPATSSPADPQLSDVQREMIERNRLVAAERRRARLEARKQNDNVASLSQDTNVKPVVSSSELTKQQHDVSGTNQA